jgi:hypothetical protein
MLGGLNMNIPNLTRIVDAYIPIANSDFSAYLDQLRREVLFSIRKLQSDELLGWYSFLIHGPDNLNGREPLDGRLYIHLRLEPKNGVDIDEFIRNLPTHFLKPMKTPLADIGGLDSSVLRNDDWAYAWKMHGEASEWVLFLLENHKDQAAIPLQHIIQFLHYITNPLMLGHKCFFIPLGYTF